MKKVKVANKDTGDLVGGQLEVEEIPGWRPDRRQLAWLCWKGHKAGPWKADGKTS